MDDEQALRDEFKSWNWRRLGSDRLTAKAAKSGPAGAELLAQLTRSPPNGFVKGLATVYLGEAKGRAGIPEPRATIRTDVERDVKWS
jgi:hypothetical protein